MFEELIIFNTWNFLSAKILPFYFNDLGLNIHSFVDFYPGSEFLQLILKSFKIGSYNRISNVV